MADPLLEQARSSAIAYTSFNGALTASLMDLSAAKSSGNQTDIQKYQVEVNLYKEKATAAKAAAETALAAAQGVPGADGATFSAETQENKDIYSTISSAISRENKYFETNLSQADAALTEVTLPSGEIPTNPSQTDADTAAKYADTTNIVPTLDATNFVSQPNISLSKSVTSQPSRPTAATPTFGGGKDHRVRLKVPMSYLVGQAAGPNNTLVKSQGIIFPYTPTIGQEYTATYNSISATHSNYNQYFYKNSSVSTISLGAKFTVQNDYEAEVYFSILHLLRALTKMRWGDDENAGSPPPVCRLFAYGDAIMNNVPVAVSSVKVDFPENVDYFTSKSLSSAPVLSTITVTLTPVYSRNEIQQFTVSDYLNNNIRSKGYL